MIWRFAASDAVSARRSRHEFLSALQEAGCPDTDLYSAEIIFGELLGNAARHASGPVAVELRCTKGQATLSVHDKGGGFQISPELPDAFAEYGRGLYLVNKLAKRVTVRRSKTGGTRVTVTLPVALPHTLNSIDST